MCPDSLRKLFRCLDGHLLISNDQQLWHVRWATNLTVGRPLTSPESIFGLKNIFVLIVRYSHQVRAHTVESRWWGSEPPVQILLSSRWFCSTMPTTVRQCLSGTSANAAERLSGNFDVPPASIVSARWCSNAKSMYAKGAFTLRYAH